MYHNVSRHTNLQYPHQTSRDDILNDYLYSALQSQINIKSILANNNVPFELQNAIRNEVHDLMTVIVEQQGAFQFKSSTMYDKGEDVFSPWIMSSSSSSGIIYKPLALLPPAPPPPPPPQPQEKNFNFSGIPEQKEPTMSSTTTPTSHYAVLIYPMAARVNADEFHDNDHNVNDEAEDGENRIGPDTILSDIKNNIDIKKNNIRVVYTRPIRNNGMVVQLQSKEDFEKFVVEFRANQVANHYEIKIPKKLDPRVIIFEVDENVPENSILMAIMDQVKRATRTDDDKDKDEDNTIHSNNNRIQMKRKTKTRRGNCNYVVSVDGNTFQKLVSNGKLQIDWAMYNVVEYDIVKQCFRCGRFGHLRKLCRLSASEELCRWCGDRKHHDYDNGNNNNNRRLPCFRRANCLNCQRKNRKPGNSFFLLPTDHSCYDRGCPIRRAEIQKFKKTRIDYSSGCENISTPL